MIVILEVITQAKFRKCNANDCSPAVGLQVVVSDTHTAPDLDVRIESFLTAFEKTLEVRFGPSASPVLLVMMQSQANA
eukprot:scaffold488825_cov19-Prasinocladus_malaysianus.AAC.1